MKEKDHLEDIYLLEKIIAKNNKNGFLGALHEIYTKFDESECIFILLRASNADLLLFCLVNGYTESLDLIRIKVGENNFKQAITDNDFEIFQRFVECLSGIWESLLREDSFFEQDEGSKTPVIGEEEYNSSKEISNLKIEDSEDYNNFLKKAEGGFNFFLKLGDVKYAIELRSKLSCCKTESNEYKHIIDKLFDKILIEKYPQDSLLKIIVWDPPQKFFVESLEREKKDASLTIQR